MIVIKQCNTQPDDMRMRSQDRALHYSASRGKSEYPTIFTKLLVLPCKVKSCSKKAVKLKLFKRDVDVKSHDGGLQSVRTIDNIKSFIS